MKQFGTLYKYELKKIAGNRITQTAFIIMIVTAVIQGVFQVWDRVGVGSKRSIIDELSILSGRTFDEELYGETVSKCLDEYGVSWNPQDVAYDEVAAFIVKVMGGGDVGYARPLSDYSASEVYEKRLENIEYTYGQAHLTDGEVNLWREKESRVIKPFTWMAPDIPGGIFDGLTNYSSIGLMFVALTLASVFAGEHRAGSDQMILCTRNGRSVTYCAKVLAGCTFIVAGMAVVVVVFLVMVFAWWGTEGMEGAVQLVLPFSSLPVTNGRLTGFLVVMLFAGILLYAMCTMFLSECLKNGVAVMGTLIGGFVTLYIVSGMVPYQYRSITQILDMNPLTFISERVAYEYRLIHIGGHYLMAYQVVPVIYLAICAVLFFAGKRMYNRYQVGK